MATLKERRPENVDGEFYVDRTCIDCDTCRWMMPAVFHRDNGQSAVYRQPKNEGERLQALQALLSCPTASIGTVDRPKDIREAQESFPLAIADNVYHCGYHSEKSFGAASYLIRRQGGNILVDSPRFTPPLVKKLEAMGGIRYLYLTHRDDIADHQKFRDHFGCDRLLHEQEIREATQDIEIKLRGFDPIQFAPDLQIIPVPGHTEAHTVLLYDNRFLFTGDHLAWSDRLQSLIAFRNHCWYSWPKLVESMHDLAHYSFEWVLPGHGRRYHADRETMGKELQKLLDWMKTEAV
ncbi:MBL fold metallo-hydrolase [Oxynema aestuarii]|jgi:glyoxylase-like metal-dependent hydrolase (beta-lactamase superfamily II)/ferredoxin|uniref:MBL fold metallo-hydrolase n=1 Tax=Oxynema aestuarii AP17 TaxID=2064643 RepID=A0A6H1TSW0_9CYAN|nr:MBL fold metallo-hydrolase [Oxynema aestuarii]QIZ69684.1 MBL fold metallo-hydrolase [Oxynema aestuarii AP17]RMH77691.1 MAG: MBL fold metallo-hydrolase [Cyanobacteria bacterium J007]